MRTESNASPEKPINMPKFAVDDEIMAKKQFSNVPKFNIDDELIVQRLNTVTETDSGTDFMDLSAVDDLNKEEKAQLKNELVAKTAKDYDTNDLENSEKFTEKYTKFKEMC